MKAKIWSLKRWTTSTDAAYLKETLSKALSKSGFTVLSYQEHQFSPFGFTGLWLLAESHLAVHTFPEENRSYIELSSCNERKHNTFIQALDNATETF